MVGDGQNFFIWYDNWHLEMCLFDVCGPRTGMHAIGPKVH
jgi:hypothetical protein